MTAHMSPKERKADGKARRQDVPRSSHGDWSPAADRPDPVDVITSQDADRVQPLVPIRHGRMAVSPFTFYRGAAKIMAGDLASTTSSGLDAQLCGDAHLANFGSYASPDRRQVFDVNDFDETLPGPWEWDLKRLATSFVLAGRDNGFDKKAITAVTTKSAAGYRQAMAKFAGQRTLDVWYSQATLADIAAALPKKKDKKWLSKDAAKARSKDSLKARSKLAENVGGTYRIKSQAPLLLPLRDLAKSMDPDELRAQVTGSLESYRNTLADNRRVLFDRFELVDIALKVVGVGSVGTRCMIVLFQGRDQDDPLFLQVKEAEASVLEDHLPKSTYEEHGERVVRGQRLMQASSDIFLGWETVPEKHHYYWRQFHDMKGSADVASMNERRMENYAHVCGSTLAHAHARSGDAIAIAGYLGSGDSFDTAVTEFAFTYADQNDRDYAAFTAAIDNGQIEAADG
ncbi:MAG: DUF2252 domain-containing protein [Ilumatobacteraceae bacterium]